MTDTTDAAAAAATINQLAPLIARATTDPAFRSSLLSAPAATLASAGAAIPAGASLRVVENGATPGYLIVPATPSEIPDDVQQQLKSLAASTAAPTSPLDAYAKLIIDAWQDGQLMSALLSNPAAALAQAGIALPAGVSVHSLEATDSQLYMTVPASASDNATSSTTLGEMAESITSSFTNLSKLITAGSYIAGLAFSIGAIMKFKQHKDNPTQIPVGTPIALIFIAAALLFLPSILAAVKGSET